jgi:GTP:adenosylcobinamide-phosphate guanylyltransferase
LLLAGGSADEALAAEAGTELRALAPVAGRPIASYVIEAARSSELITKIIVVTEPEAAEQLGLKDGEWIPSAESLMDNAIGGAKAFSDDIDAVLLCPCDVPLATGPMLDRFIRTCLDLGAPLCYAVLAQEACVGPLAGVRKTWVPMREGMMAGGNLALVSRAFVSENEASIRNAMELRKRPLALAAKLGFGVLIRLALSRYLPVRVPIRTAEVRASRLLGCESRAVVLADPELGIDVDKPEDLRFVSSVLG